MIHCSLSAQQISERTVFFVRHMKGCVHYNNRQGFKIIWSKDFGMSCLQFQRNLIIQWVYLLNITHVCKPKENISSKNMVSKSLPLTAIMWTLPGGKLLCWWSTALSVIMQNDLNVGWSQLADEIISLYFPNTRSVNKVMRLPAYRMIWQYCGLALHMKVR